ncbi:MAG: heavy-metal-associated domain-containing protein [Proteobacteria bacterium]|nr:heavy-metal-associated domain-containing protein [Pseudomonadota bacterium]
MQTVTLGISGMTCGGCVRSVTNVLKAQDGVAKADVSLEKNNAVIEFDPGKVQVDQLKRSVEEAGFEITA